MHAIVYDDIHDEIVVTHTMGQAILTFRGGADGEEPPIRIIQGSRTELRDPERLAVDSIHDEIFVPSEGNSVLVYNREAQGNVAPIRVLRAPEIQLVNSAVAVDPVHNLLIVGGTKRGEGGRLVIFNRTDQGAAKPKAIIGGPKSRFPRVSGPFAVYPPTGRILVTVRGGSENELATEESFVGVWSIGDSGDVPPQWTIGGPKGMLRQPRGVALDPANKNLIISDKYLNAVLTYNFPEIF
jgi:DNA-binding beta-propeller fold protein YncE